MGDKVEILAEDKISLNSVKEINDLSEKASGDASDAKNTADKAQGTADKAQSSATKAQSTADKAQTSANTAQSTADKAQNSADKAQSTATEAAKTADNYISTDSTGIMVSENKGATKETPSNATKNNVLITEQDVRIREGQTVLASYGKKTVLGDQNSNTVELASDGITLKDGGFTSATIKALKAEQQDMETTESFDGNAAYDAVQSDKTWHNKYTLSGAVGSLKNVYLNGPSVNSFFIPQTLVGPYGCLRRGSEVEIRIDGSIAEASNIDWSKYTTVTFTYTKWKDTTGVITSDEVHCINSYAEEVDATERLLVGDRSSLVAVNNVKKKFVVGNGDLVYRSNAAAIMENGDCRLAGDVYVGCKNDSTEGVPLGRVLSGKGNISLTTGEKGEDVKWCMVGYIASISVQVKCAGKVGSGSNIAAGYITDVPKPMLSAGVRGISYYGNNANVTFMGSDGTFYARNCGSDSLAKGNDVRMNVTYITDGTML